MWLAGGASNTGGNVLLAFFKAEALADLSALIDPATDSGLDYYPLARPGERFPIADPELPPRLSPRPAKDEDFLKGILEGMANIEALSYRRLAELGAPQLASVRTVGGGAGNPAWRQLRARWLRVPLLPAGSTEAAYGAALLAKRGGAAA
jgi:sugar (pentulose or hexulose) kinase